MSLKYTLPPRPATRAAADDIAAWETLVVSSLPRAQATAETWRNGLAGFVTLLTAAVVLKGPESADQMQAGWRFAVGLLIIVGVGLAIVSLWSALRAASPRLAAAELGSTVAQWGSVQAAEVGAALQSAKLLTHAKFLMAGALLALALGYGGWWIAPAATEQSVTVTTSDGNTLCGPLRAAETGFIVVEVQGVGTTVPLGDVASIEPSASCSG